MEQYKLYAFIYLITSFVSYVTYITLKFGILPSISDSYYKFKGLGKALFTLFIWSTAIPFMIIGETTLMFFAGAFLAFVGAAPAFKNGMDKTVHVVGATTGILFGFLSLTFDFKMPYMFAIMAAFYLVALLTKFKNNTFWTEILAYVLMIIGLYISNV